MCSTVIQRAQQGFEIRGLDLVLREFSELRCVVFAGGLGVCVFSVLAGAACKCREWRRRHMLEARPPRISHDIHRIRWISVAMPEDSGLWDFDYLPQGLCKEFVGVVCHWFWQQGETGGGMEHVVCCCK